ncbi:VWA domain-containing protein [Aquibacillus rhizosphaerae]|uniref:VWA domain-containing protein n=1 Tax=Aquibacillus rhizosphaerae TaxID=3051431 RepID=A0ABT7L311_9BACI|nr:VWA domain-containing protein [Aquibacillus sp. LR5S19]MDL4840251.1 VWA domain-containing protein [Aquibacillus sp. LR5S19]
MKKYFIYLGLMLVLASCSSEDETLNQAKETSNEVMEENEKNSNQNTENSMIEKLDSIKLVQTKEDMKKQQGGVLLNNISMEEELAVNEEERLQEINEELREQLEDITKQTQDPVQLEKALTYLLGSHHYKQIFENAEEFEPDFEEPYLPYPGKSKAEVKQEPKSGKAIILLDASSSMLLSVDERMKMDVAKEATSRFAEVIGQESDVSLVVYGHKGSESDSDKVVSCEGIEEIYPMDTYDQEVFETSLTTFESKGWTPLAEAIKKAADMSDSFEEAITVYIVSDGVETCDGDPVKEAENFVKKDEERTVNIIGFNVDQDAEEELQNVSAAGNGDYYTANNADDLQKTIEYEWLPSAIDLAWAFTKAPGPWEILDAYNLFDVEHEKIKTTIKNENDRYNHTVNILAEEEMLSSEVISELQDSIEEKYQSRLDILLNTRSKKIEEIDESADKIKERVNEWTEEMRKRRDERGDIW